MHLRKRVCAFALFGLPLLAAGPAGAYYVQFTANLGVFSPGEPSVQNEFINSGQLAQASVSQPYVYHSDVGAAGEAVATVEGEAALGRVDLTALGSAYQGDLNTSNYNISPFLGRPGWGDQMTVTNGGTFRFTVTFISRVWGGPSKGAGQGTTPGAECSSNIATVYFDIPGEGTVTLQDQLCDGDQGIEVRTAHQDVIAVTGTVLDVTGQIEYYLIGNSNSATRVQTEISGTAYFSIDPITPGADYSMESGADYRTQVLDDDVAALNGAPVGGDPLVAVALDDHGASEAYIKNASTGADIGFVTGAPGRLLRDAAMVDDRNGDGVDEVALLLDDPSANVPKVEIHDTVTGTRLRTVSFNRDYSGVALAIVPDQNGNLVQEAAVLARQDGDHRARLLIRDVGDSQKVNNIWLPKVFEPLDLAMTADANGNGAPEALVLARRKSDGRGYVLVWDIQGELVMGKRVYKLRHIVLPKNQTPVSFVPLTGPGGVAAVAVASIRQSDGAGRLAVYDILTGAKLWAVIVGGGRLPVALRAFESSAGQGRLALLTQRSSDQRPIVVVFDVETGIEVSKVGFGVGQQALDLVVLPDLTLDANSEPELGVLVKGVGLRVRDSDQKTLLETIGIP